MSTVAKILWVIESRFREPLTLDDLVEATGRSKSHLSRVFPLMTGHSISGYLRGRRLTEAAKLLANGAPDILSVALEAGYSSHEAFTRAFRDQFGMTPEELRRRRDLESIQLVEPHRMDTISTDPIDPPRLESRPPMWFAGLSQRHMMSNPAGLPAQWQQFQPYIGNIEGAVPGAAYGIVGDTDGGEFEYIVASEVREDAEIPPELKRIALPAMTFARFAHKGDITAIRDTIDAAAGWLTRNGREPSEVPYSFLEYYGPAFDPVSGTGAIEVWFGLKS